MSDSILYTWSELMLISHLRMRWQRERKVWAFYWLQPTPEQITNLFFYNTYFPSSSAPLTVKPATLNLQMLFIKHISARLLSSIFFSLFILLIFVNIKSSSYSDDFAIFCVYSHFVYFCSWINERIKTFYFYLSSSSIDTIFLFFFVITFSNFVVIWLARVDKEKNKLILCALDLWTFLSWMR